MPIIEKGGILYVSCGVPGSGKSTFLNEFKGEDEIVISRDNIRYSLLKPGEDYYSHERESYQIFLQLIKKNIQAGKNVYADATHLNASSRFALLKNLNNRGCHPCEINAIYFKIPLKVCFERNEMRKNTPTYVPEDQLRQMYGQFSPPHAYEGFNNIWEVNEEGDVNIIYERSE